MFVPALEALQIGRRGAGRPRTRPHRLANTLQDLAGDRQHETARAGEDKETAR